MRILVVGGTSFVGRHIVAEALGRGHQLTLLHRGETGAGLFQESEHLLADRNDAGAVAKSLDGRSFDATIDVCAYVPRQVRDLAGALGGRGGHHVFISTVSVYDDPAGPGADESSPLTELADKDTEEVTGQTYGGLKVECERAAQASYESLAIVRPTYVVGPFDPTGRFTRWVDRIARGGEVLAPGPRDVPFQLIDGRDQAELVVSLAERGQAGVFNSIGTPAGYTFGDLLDEIVATVGPEGTELVWVDGAWLADEGAQRRPGGDLQLPLWSEGETEYVMAMSNAAALAAGMPTRPVADTIRDTAAWLDELSARGESPYRIPPMTAEREAELLAAWRSAAE
jgi:2'-hydroxyisoflavone reductase